LFNIITVVFDGPPPPFIVRTLRDGTPQVQTYVSVMRQHIVCMCIWCITCREVRRPTVDSAFTHTHQTLRCRITTL